ncbi:MAG: hypothetical protein ACKVWR_11195 [Acidimicrobiales bacterium]
MKGVLEGVIASAAFSSGDRIVVGMWASSPVGPLSDVMWADGGGVRRLLAPTAEAAAFIESVYRFDEVQITPVHAQVRGPALEVRAGPLELRAQGGRARLLPWPRPRWVTRWVESPIAAAAFGVHTHGRTVHGVQEWYQARSWRWIVWAEATAAGSPLGGLTEFAPPARFGFSEPPRRPALVRLRTVLIFPQGSSPHPRR